MRIVVVGRKKRFRCPQDAQRIHTLWFRSRSVANMHFQPKYPDGRTTFSCGLYCSTLLERNARFGKSYQLRLMCVPGVVLARDARHLAELKNTRFVRGVSQTPQNGNFGPRVFSPSCPGTFCDTPHAEPSLFDTPRLGYTSRS